MCMIAEELENKGIEKGRKEGIKQGLNRGIKKGIKKGLNKGKQEGEERFGKLSLKMLEVGNYDALKRASVDKRYRNSLYKKYGL